MNAETILQSDLLDILFENKNKEYGAYPLRKDYNKRLYKSLAVIASLVLVLYGWYYLQNRQRPDSESAAGSIATPDSVILKKVEILKPPPPVQKIIPPVATITNPPPVIVPDNQVTDTMHTIDDFENKVISDVTKDGPAAATDNQTASVPEPAASTAPEPPAEPAVVEYADVMPEFPGGTGELGKFLGKNLQVPEDAMESGQKVRVQVRFVIDKEGGLSDVEFLTQTDNVFKKEIMRVMAKMPRWKPGQQHGKKVAVYYTLPVIFELGEN